MEVKLRQKINKRSLWKVGYLMKTFFTQSIPFANDFVREFPNAELVLIGAADEELGNAHAPNESVQIDHIEMLIESLVKTLKNI